MYYSFEGDGWVQLVDGLNVIGNASVTSGPYVRSGQQSVQLNVGSDASGFRKTLPMVQTPGAKCTLSFFLAIEGENTPSNPYFWIEFIDPFTGQIYDRRKGELAHGTIGWREFGRWLPPGQLPAQRPLEAVIRFEPGNAPFVMHVDDMSWSCVMED
jgi:hypothetical protein